MSCPTQNTAIFRHEFTVSDEATDQNGHVNNVVYVQWMQDVAVLHSEATGGTRAMEAAGGRWVVRAHQIEYLSPAFAGDRVEAVTWVADFRRIRSTRRYKFVRTSDDRLLARGETDWVFVDTRSGRPRTIPEEVSKAFTISPDGEEA